MNKIVQIVKKRFIFYIVGYLLAYLISVANIGTVDIKKLFPINIVDILMGLCFGTLIFYIIQRKSPIEGTLRGIKYVIFITVMLILAGTFYRYLLDNYGIDITPYLGF